MKEYAIELLDKFPHLKSQILSFASKHMIGSADLINSVVKALYADKAFDKELAYKAFYDFVKSAVDSKPLLPRAEYIREGLVKEKLAANMPTQMLYRQLEEAASQQVDLEDDKIEAIERALDYIISATEAYNAAYSTKSVASHADKTGDIIHCLRQIKNSHLSVMVKFKEMQRLIKMELEHKTLTRKQYDEYQAYIDENKGKDFKELLASKDFVGSGHSFSKAMLTVLRYSEEFASRMSINQKIQESLSDLHEGGLRVLGRNAALFNEIFSSSVKNLYQQEFMKVVLPRLYQLTLTEADHKEIYKAIRDFLINTKDEKYQRALIELLGQEDRLVDDVVRHVIAFEDAQRIMKQFEGLVISEDMIASRIDEHQEELAAYTADRALRAIERICAELKLDIAKDLSKIIGSGSNINALEKMDAVRGMLQIKEAKLSSKDIPALENELAAYDYKVLGEHKEKTLLFRSVRGLSEAKTKEYAVRALQSVIASYEREILSKVTKIDYAPEVGAVPIAMGERPRAMSTRIRGRSFVSPIPSVETPQPITERESPKAESPLASHSSGFSDESYNPTLFGGRRQDSGPNTPKGSPTHGK